MKKWTTPEQFAWLTERFPQWRSRKQKGNKGFCKRTTAEFLKAFPDVAREGLEKVLHSFPVLKTTDMAIENQAVVPIQ